MRLLQLTSSNPKFRTINFEPGLNIVVGTQLTNEQKKSINGIGKSMSLSLVHYMFGAKFDAKSEADVKLKRFLSSYGDFSLSFTHNSKKFIIRKNFGEDEFYINNQKVLKTNYPKRLNDIFIGSENAKPSFKQFFNCFARRYSSHVNYYSNILAQQSRPLEDYHQRYVNLSLLKLDLELVEKRKDIKEKKFKLEKAQKTIKEYQKVLEESNVNDIDDEIVNLKEQLQNFIIAENFDKIKKEADLFTNELNSIRNKIYNKENKLSRKLKSFDNSKNTVVDLKKIETLFSEANFFFEEKVVKRLEDAQEFHKNLINNRKKRLKIEIEELKISLNELSVEKKNIAKKRDAILKDLDNSGAIEERDSLKDRIVALEKEQSNLKKYESLLKDFNNDKIQLDIDDAVLNQKCNLYLEKNQEYLDSIQDLFRKLVKQFYNNKGGSFKITPAPIAKYLFNIATHIPKEGSQGVGEVKIFCYDVLLYLMNKDLFNFMAHDGCLFSEMDPRQKSNIFKIILKLIKNNELQYFINISDASLLEVLDEKNKINILEAEEKKLIKDSIRLELTDKEPKDWLFGVNFD